MWRVMGRGCVCGGGGACACVWRRGGEGARSEEKRGCARARTNPFIYIITHNFEIILAQVRPTYIILVNLSKTCLILHKFLRGRALLRSVGPYNPFTVSCTSSGYNPRINGGREHPASNKCVCRLLCARGVPRVSVVRSTDRGVVYVACRAVHWTLVV